MKLYILDRYVGGKLMAQGAEVHAESEAEAKVKARALFEYNRPSCSPSSRL